MTLEEIRAVWSAKIDSYDAYANAWAKTRGHEVMPRLSSLLDALHLPDTNTSSYKVTPHMESGELWPLCREIIRERVGVYPEPTAALVDLRNYGLAGMYFPHMSPEDPTMVAYTPDRQSLLADRQVRTTMGRVLRKFLILATDDMISAIEATHRADLDGTWMEAAKAEDIGRVYRGMPNDGSCMRYSEEHFGLMDHHPSEVYEAPGIRVAYLPHQRNPEQVRARTVIYVNPEDPADKRYVRVYGDLALEKKLKRAGFRNAGLAGARVAALTDSGLQGGYYVMPYLDKAGGPHSSNPDCDPVSLVKYDDEDFIRVLDVNERNASGAAGFDNALQSAKQTSGRVGFPRVINRSEVTGRCPLSSRAYNTFTDKTAFMVQADGTVAKVLADELLLAQLNGQFLDVTALVAGKAVKATIRAEHESLCFYPHGKDGTRYVRSDELMSKLNLQRLCAEYYGEERYETKYAVQKLVTYTDADGNYTSKGYVMSKEAVYVWLSGQNGRHNVVHESEVKALRKAGYVALGVKEGSKWMCHKDDPKLVTTVSGRKAYIGLHDISKLWNGSWDFDRNTHTRFVLGSQVRYSDKSPIEVGVVLTESLFDHDSVQDQSQLDRCVRRLACATTGQMQGYFVKDDLLVRAGYYNSAQVSAAQYMAAARKVLEMTDEQLSGAVYTIVDAKLWAINLVWAHDQLTKKLEKYTAEQAAQAAIEAARVSAAADTAPSAPPTTTTTAYDNRMEVHGVKHGIEDDMWVIWSENPEAFGVYRCYPDGDMLLTSTYSDHFTAVRKAHEYARLYEGVSVVDCVLPQTA